MASDTDESGFLSRWSRRKAQSREDVAEPDATAPARPAAPLEAPPAAPPATPPAAPPAAAEPPAPTLADVAALTRESDYARFVAPGVDSQVKNAALKKLFSDPHFNLMDGLDTYIDDYGRPDPLPAGLLRQMAQATALGLFGDEAPAGPPEAPSRRPTPGTETASPLPDEDAAMRLQPHDAAGPAGAGLGVEPDPGREP